MWPYLFIISRVTHSPAPADSETGTKYHYTIIRLPSTFHCPLPNGKYSMYLHLKMSIPFYITAVICKSCSSEHPSKGEDKRQPGKRFLRLCKSGQNKASTRVQDSRGEEGFPKKKKKKRIWTLNRIGRSTTNKHTDANASSKEAEKSSVWGRPLVAFMWVSAPVFVPSACTATVAQHHIT